MRDYPRMSINHNYQAISTICPPSAEVEPFIFSGYPHLPLEAASTSPNQIAETVPAHEFKRYPLATSFAR
jgi:hypothetical protein